MSSNLRIRALVATAATLGFLTAAAARAETAAPSTLKQVGATAIVYKGPQVSMVVSYKFPKNNPGESWLLLDTAMTTARGTVEVPRTAIAVRTPQGEVVKLATEEAFLKGYRELGSAILRADATPESLVYLVPHRYRRLEYFARPGGHGLAYPSVWLDDWHNVIGRLYFQIPGTVQKGTYTLLVDLSESQVEIPFTI
jgi:hypothetical protein